MTLDHHLLVGEMTTRRHSITNKRFQKECSVLTLSCRICYMCATASSSIASVCWWSNGMIYHFQVFDKAN